MRARLPEPPAPLAGRVADAHCHLDMIEDGGGPGPAESVRMASAARVAKIIHAGCDVAGSRRAVELAQAHRDVLAAVAVHPNEVARIHEASGLPGVEAAWAEIATLAAAPEVRAVGETGMDFYRTAPPGRAIQEESFRRHIGIAKDLGKTLVVHDREAHEDVLRILDDEGAPGTVVLHCFSGDADFAAQASARGWYCSFAGVITFKNAAALRDAAAAVPEELLLVETDAPFLAPAPHRGKTNGSYLLPLTVRQLASLRGLAEPQMCARLWENTRSAFGEL